MSLSPGLSNDRSPKHPALFVTANISGELGLWNLNHSMEEPFTPPVKVCNCCWPDGVECFPTNTPIIFGTLSFHMWPLDLHLRKLAAAVCSKAHHSLVSPIPISVAFPYHVNVTQVVDRCALTRMAWSPDGRRLCVGDAKVCDVCHV